MGLRIHFHTSAEFKFQWCPLTSYDYLYLVMSEYQLWIKVQLERCDDVQLLKEKKTHRHYDNKYDLLYIVVPQKMMSLCLHFTKLNTTP